MININGFLLFATNNRQSMNGKVNEQKGFERRFDGEAVAGIFSGEWARSGKNHLWHNDGVVFIAELLGFRNFKLIAFW